MLNEHDRREIADLMVRYCNMIDERRFSRFDEVFTPTAHYDLSQCGLAECHGREEIIAFLKVAPHPLLHVTVNLELASQTEDLVHGFSRCLAIGADGLTRLGTYDDVLLRTVRGWRLDQRIVTTRDPESIPDPS